MPTNINKMTMQEVISEAKKRGFKGNECSRSYYHTWENSVECKAYAFLKENAPELFE